MKLTENFYIIKIRFPYRKKEKGLLKAYVPVTKFVAMSYLKNDKGQVVRGGRSWGPIKREAERLDQLYARMDPEQQEQQDNLPF